MLTILSDSDSDSPPRDNVFQCLQVKQLPSAAGATERYRVVLSDGQNFIQAMVATQMNDQVKNNTLIKGVLIKLNGFTVNKMKERRIIIILEADVLPDPPIDKVGNPTALDPTGDASGTVKTEPSASTTSNFYGNQTTSNVPKRQESARPVGNANGGAMGNSAIYPIEALSPYQNKWTIKARVISKSDVKQWHNQKGEGKLFSCTFMDESGEIRATGFNDAVDNLYELLQEGQVYMISKCRVNIAKKQFSNVNNEYELMFERDTEISPCDDAEDVPQVKFQFMPLSQLDSVEKDATVDVIAVIKEIGEAGEITSKTTSKPYSKRDLSIVDESGFSVKLTVWGKQATTDFNLRGEEIVAWKGLRVSDFGGRTLSMSNSSLMQVNPEIPEAYSLKGWYDSAGKSGNFNTHTNTMSVGGATGRQDPRKTLAQVKDENLGLGETPDYFSTKATVVFIKQEGVSYPACRSEGCNKKVLEDGEGGWRCEKCDKSHESPEYRYIMTISVNDHTGQQWLNCFDEVGRQILGMDATALQKLKEEDEQAAAEVFQKGTGQAYIFKVQAKQDNYNGQVRVRYQVRGCTTLDFDREIELLKEQIGAYNI